MKKGWEIKKLGDLTTIKTGKLNANAMVENGDYAFFTCSREVFRIDNYAFDCEAILLAGNNASGDFNVKHYKGKFNAYQRTYVITIDDNDKLLYVYLKYKMEANLLDFKNQSLGANTKFLKIGMIESMPIPIPPLEEQQQIVAFLDEVFEAIEQAQANIEKNVENAKELFQSKLNEIFSQTGEGWEEKKIIELCKHKSQIVGGPFGSNLKVEDYRESGIPILRLQNIGKGHFIDKRIKYVSTEKAKELEYHSFVDGDIVLAKLGIPIGKTCIVPQEFPFGIVVADVVRIRPNKDKVDYDFLKHFLNSDSSVKQLSADIRGATRPRVNISEVRNLKLSLPSMEKQIELRLYIDELESHRNDLISNYIQKLTNLEDLKKSILEKAFAGELTYKDMTA
ncbi:restriction endonuclease subunit S [Psychrobacter alimentarius]|uniref:restriction endonuclease subunit S n=1 Tax=Psychrobacter alimentarius TaxID=261164 RepID=UPI003FD4CBF8